MTYNKGDVVGSPSENRKDHLGNTEYKQKIH